MIDNAAMDMDADKPKKRTRLSKEDALLVLQKYCAYQERCHQEVRSRLIEYQVYGDDLEEVISALIQEGYLNETRFAELYVSGKYRIKKWGRIKITSDLKRRQISTYNIKKGLAIIDEDIYKDNLKDLLEKKDRYLRYTSDYDRKQKLLRYAQQKGYEYHIFAQVLEDIDTQCL